MDKGKRKLLIFWGILILAIVVELVISGVNKSKIEKKTVATGSDEIQNIEQKVSSTEDEKPKSKKPENKINFTKNSIILYVGSSETLSLENMSSSGVNWSSSHDKIATVNSSGTVTGVSIGTSIIKVEAPDGTYGTCSVVVAQKVVQTEKPKAPDSNGGQNNNFNDNQNNYQNPDLDNNNFQDNNYYEEPDDNQFNPDDYQNPDDFYNPENPENPDDMNGEENQEPVFYTVRFVLDGEEYDTIEVEEGQIIPSFPNDPVRTGYTFKGWFLGQSQVTNDFTVYDNMVITGEWDSYTFAVNLIYNDVSSPNRVIVAYKNGNIIGANTIYGSLNGNNEYVLGRLSSTFGTVKIVSYAQFSKASNYKLRLSTGETVFANIIG